MGNQCASNSSITSSCRDASSNKAYDFKICNYWFYFEAFCYDNEVMSQWNFEIFTQTDNTPRIYIYYTCCVANVIYIHYRTLEVSISSYSRCINDIGVYYEYSPTSKMVLNGLSLEISFDYNINRLKKIYRTRWAALS
jgi:hypothetical protein